MSETITPAISDRHQFPNLLAEKFYGLKVDRFLISRIDQDDESLEVFQAIASKL